jgi:hypothetical protein
MKLVSSIRDHLDETLFAVITTLAIIGTIVIHVA